MKNELHFFKNKNETNKNELTDKNNQLIDMTGTIDMLGEDKNNLMQKLSEAANDISYLRETFKDDKSLIEE